MGKKLWCFCFFILLFGGTLMTMLGIELPNVDLNGVYTDENMVLHGFLGDKERDLTSKKK